MTRAGRTLTLAKRHTKPTQEQAANAVDIAAGEVERAAMNQEKDSAMYGSNELLALAREDRRVARMLRDLAAALRAEGGKR